MTGNWNKTTFSTRNCDHLVLNVYKVLNARYYRAWVVRGRFCPGL